MSRKTVLTLCLALISAACVSAPPPPPPAESSTGGVVMLRETLGEERTADVGGSILGLSKTEDGKKSTGFELVYLGLTDKGQIRLRVVPTDPAEGEAWRRRLSEEGYTPSKSGPVEFDQDPREAFVADEYTVEFIEAQPSQVRYRLTLADAQPE